MTNLANAPDELVKVLQRQIPECDIFIIKGLSQKNHDVIKNIITSNDDKSVIMHFHNLKYDAEYLELPHVKKIIHYHSEPSRVMLNIDDDYKKIVLNQYHCTLPEYENCEPVRNVFDYQESIVFNDKIKIGYYPSTTIRQNQYYDKGYDKTVPILRRIKEKYGDQIIIDIGTGMPYNKYIDRKKDCHILIDECVTGSYHKSTIESLVMGTIVFCWMTDALVEKNNKIYGRIPPVINAKIDDLETKLIEHIDMGIEKLEDMALRANLEFTNYWSNDIIASEYAAIYDSLTN